MKIIIHDQENNTSKVYTVSPDHTIGKLKELYCEEAKDTDVKDVKAWNNGKTPLIDNNVTLFQYNLAHDNIDIYMAKDWPEEVSAILKYYL